MKILVITSHYPPYHLGGYEIRGRDVVEGLARQGHEILVVTSRESADAQATGSRTGYTVLRMLRIRGMREGLSDRLARRRGTHSLGMLLTFTRELLFDLQDLAVIDALNRRIRPDLIYLGHVTPLSKSVVPYLAGLQTPLLYDEGCSGLIDCWTAKNIWYKFTDEIVPGHFVVKGLKSFVVGVIGRLSGGRLKPRWAWPANMHVFFNDELGLRNAVAHGVPVSSAKVVYSGVDTEKFRFRPRLRLSVPVKIIVPGRFEARKGQVDAVRLVAELGRRGMEAEAVLVGAVWSDSYHRELTAEISRLGLEDKVRLLQMVTQGELAGLYQVADICFFPSYFRTGFSRVPLEAMASGCITISYGNEGSDEIIRDGQTGFLVPCAGFERIAGLVNELRSDPGRLNGIARAARSEIEARFSLDRYVDSIEQLVMNAVEAT